MIASFTENVQQIETKVINSSIFDRLLTSSINSSRSVMEEPIFEKMIEQERSSNFTDCDMKEELYDPNDTTENQVEQGPDQISIERSNESNKCIYIKEEPLDPNCIAENQVEQGPAMILTEHSNDLNNCIKIKEEPFDSKETLKMEEVAEATTNEIELNNENQENSGYQCKFCSVSGV